MTEEQIKIIIERVLNSINENTDGDNKRSTKSDSKKENAWTDKKNMENSRQGSNSGDEDDVIPDIREDDYRSYLGIENPANAEEFIRIKMKTDARMGLGRSGPRYKTSAYLRMLVDHAGAYDAALSEAPESIAEENNMFPTQTCCSDKDEYLSRPDLGRMFSDEMKKNIAENCTKNADVQIILSEGLSTTAMEYNTNDLFPALQQGLKIEGLSTGTPIYVKYARVPAMDVIAEILNPKVTIMLIGERPGLSTYASMSAYMAYKGKVGMPESSRNVISNIHENGINPAEAGAHLASVAKKMIEQKVSGTDFKMV